MNTEQIKENKLKMILGFSIPSIIAMLLETVITMTDGYFTGNYVGEKALAAINLGLPILYFYLGIGLCVGVGGTVICGRLLGAEDGKRANEVLSQTIVTSLVACVVISAFLAVLFAPVRNLLGADAALAGFFNEYYKVMLLNYPLMVLTTVLGMFIRVDGKPQVCMIITITGCVLNAVLDYALVAGLGLGVFGSAIGSLTVQAITALVMTGYFLSRASDLSYTRFAFDRALNKEIMFNGFSEFVGEMASAISMFVFNFVLMKYAGPEGVAAFTILGYVVYGFSMICIGFGQGLTPLVSFMFGAKEFETAIELRKITNKILFGIGVAIAAIFLLMGRSYAGLFGCSDIVVDMVVTGFRFYSATFLVMGYDVINSMYFTSCGDAKSSALISSLRGIVLLLAFTFILPMIFGMKGIWMAGPGAEILTAVVSFCLINRQRLALEEGKPAWKPEKALQ